MYGRLCAPPGHGRRPASFPTPGPRTHSGGISRSSPEGPAWPYGPGRRGLGHSSPRPCRTARRTQDAGPHATRVEHRCLPSSTFTFVLGGSPCRDYYCCDYSILYRRGRPRFRLPGLRRERRRTAPGHSRVPTNRHRYIGRHHECSSPPTCPDCRRHQRNIRERRSDVGMHVLGNAGRATAGSRKSACRPSRPARFTGR